MAIHVSDIFNNPCRTQRVNSPKICSTLLPLGKSKGQSLLHSQSSRLPDPAVVSPLQHSLDKKRLQLTGAEAGFISSPYSHFQNI